MVRSLVLVLGLIACGGPIEETLVDELRVVAAVPDRPEVAPGESFGVDVFAVDPADQGLESLVWVCTPTGPPGEPCLESLAGTTNGWAAAVDAEGRAEGLQVAPALAGALSGELEEVEIPIWVLTCEPGLCPLIQQAPSLYAIDVSWDGVVPQLNDPPSVVRELPMQGVALTRRSVLVSLRPPDARNQHPVIQVAPTDPIEAPADSEAPFVLTVADDEPTSGFGYTTLGGFDAIEVEAEEGELEVSWFPGEEAEAGDEADLYVVVSDGRGGEAVWRGSGTVGAAIGVE